MPEVTRQPDGGVSAPVLSEVEGLPDAEARMVIASQQARIGKMDALLNRARPLLRNLASRSEAHPACRAADNLLQEMNAQ
jgi:hypothetical protein